MSKSMHEMEAEFQIIEKIEFISRGCRGYRQLLLPTEFILDNPADARPEHFSIMRYSWNSDLYWFEPESKLLPYREFVGALKAAGIPFTGTWDCREACDVELWQCDGDDGHTDYQHEGNYRIVFDQSSPGEFLAGVTGAQFSYSLGAKVREFTQGIE